jgi:2-keto-4-pentenoate hydratase/2-oxohepta-3-ene-1,7-dioic acid hydratase in catechol pathway
MIENRDFVFTNGERIPVGTMYCIGRNYAAHAREMNAPLPDAPLVFIKPPNAYLPHDSVLKLPTYSDNVHHEVELVVVIGADTDGCTAEQASMYIAGYGVGIDCTLRDVQAQAKAKGEPWSVSKSFRSSAPISRIVPAAEVSSADALELVLRTNGHERQRGSTAMMERSVGELVAYISTVFGLRRGDCIFTGTPEGVGKMSAGDVVEAELCGYTSLRIQVA